MEIYAKIYGIERQSRTCEEAGIYHDSRFGGFDAIEGEENVYKRHSGWNVHASTQWKGKSHTKFIFATDYCDETERGRLMNASESGGK